MGHEQIPSECDRYRGHVANTLSNSYVTPMQQVLRLLFQTQGHSTSPRTCNYHVDAEATCRAWVLRPMSLSLLSFLPAVQSANCSLVPSPSSCRLFQLLNDLWVYSVCLSLPKGRNSSTLPAALHKNSINSPLTSSSLPASSSCS